MKTLKVLAPVCAVVLATTPALADWYGPRYRYVPHHEHRGIGPGAAIGLGVLGGVIAGGALLAAPRVYAPPPVYVPPPVYYPPPVYVPSQRCYPTGWGYVQCEGW